jgi:hypothetical protein
MLFCLKIQRGWRLAQHCTTGSLSDAFLHKFIWAKAHTVATENVSRLGQAN